MRALALGAALTALACTPRHEPPLKLSVFELFDGSAPASAPIEPAALSLALASLSPPARAELLAALTQATDAEVKRANPLIVDLDKAGTPERERLRELLRADLPAATAAANLLGSPWQSAGLRVQLGPSCLPGAARCFPAPGQHADEPLARRGASLAWAVAHAAVLRTSSPATLAQALRVRQQRPDSTIALVLVQKSGTLDAAQLSALQEQARRGARLLDEATAQRRWLEALAAAPSGWALPLPLGPYEVLVVPRLSALARLSDFHAELQSAGEFEWAASEL